MKEISYTSTILKIEGMHCASCQKPIEKALRETEGVTDVSVNLASRTVSIEMGLCNRGKVLNLHLVRVLMKHHSFHISQNLQ